VYNRFTLPQLNILSKIDLIPKNKVAEVLSWGRTPSALADAINKQSTGSSYILMRDIVRAVSRLGLDFSPIPCSAKNFDNFVSLHATIQRILRGGEEQ